MFQRITKSRGQWIAILVALALVLQSFGVWGNSGTAAASVSMETSATATPSTVQAGSSTTVQASVYASENLAVLVDLEIFDASLKKVHQVFVDNIQLEANKGTTIPFVWQVPATLPEGKYVVSLGIFSAGWSGILYKWHAGATTLTVTKGTGQEPAPELLAPSNVKGQAEETAILLSWDPVTNAAAYDVEADGILISNAASADNTTYRHAALQPDTQHTYRVRATTSSVTGPWSSLITLKTAPAVSSPSDGLKISLETSSSSSTQMPTVAFKFTNTGKNPISLSDLSARYYFTIDKESPLKVDFWSTVTKSKVTAQFKKMPIPAADADTFLEIGFAGDAGVLNPGGSATVSTWFNKTDWSVFKQTNDYSYLYAPNYTDTVKAPGYVKGILAWGAEPEPLDIPASPNHIQAMPAETSITLSWDAVEGASGYEVIADGTPAAVSEPRFEHLWLRTGTSHTYQVRTVKNGKLSAWSDIVKVRTLGEQVLPAPSNVRAERTENSIKITWMPLEETITGYDIEVDGNVKDAGMTQTYTDSGLTPGSQHTYRVRAKDGGTVGPWSDLIRVNTVFVPNGTFDVSFAIDPSAERAPISPYIYGTNDELTGSENWTARRMGGNRMSTYNWENNASNAGKDDGWRSDGYVPWFFGNIMDRSKFDIPGIGATAFHDRSLAKGSYTLLTLQTAGYAAADRNGDSVTEQAPSPRWTEVKAAKGAPFSLTPDLTDGKVYMDEFVNLIVSKYGRASSATGVKGFEIDNEPGLWADTHKYMHPVQPSGVEVLNKGIELAKAVKNVDSSVEIFGPVSYGFSEYLMMDNKAEWETIKGSYSWYLDYYLDKLRGESAKENRRLLDVLDLHWYPEATGGGVRISDPYTANNLDTHKARVQAPRTLWDPSYAENSWIGDWYKQYLPLIPKLKESIANYNPGTKLAFTEYNYGGEDHISGGIAMADALGIYGKYGLYMANYWKMTAPEKTAYSTAAVKLYTNYDGANAKYGDTKVKAETSDAENSSVYSSVFRDSDNKLHIIAMNKNFDYDMNASFAIGGTVGYKSAKVWAYDSSSSVITEREGVASIEGNTFKLKLPKLTVAHIVLSADCSSYRTEC